MPVRVGCWMDLPHRKILTLALAATLLAAGCGKGSGQRVAATDESSGEESVESDSGGVTPAKDRKGAGRNKKPARGKNIKGIPIDVWPEVWLKDPLAIAAEKGAVGGAVPAASGDSDPQVTKVDPVKPPAETDKPASGAAPAAGGPNWTALISGEVLADESKTIRTSLTEKLANKGRYDSTYKELRVDAAVLACLAGLAGEYPDPPSWKKNAKYVRDMAAEVSNGSTANGEKFYIKVRGFYDKLDELLSGNKPAGLEESADNLRFSETAKRNFLMLRMDRGFNAMKANINTEAIFKKESAKVNHEASIIAWLSKIIATPGYDSSDDPEYQKLTDSLTKASLEVTTAVKDQDFKAYNSALDRCYKACTDCHKEFKP